MVHMEFYRGGTISFKIRTYYGLEGLCTFLLMVYFSEYQATYYSLTFTIQHAAFHMVNLLIEIRFFEKSSRITDPK